MANSIYAWGGHSGRLPTSSTKNNQRGGTYALDVLGVPPRRNSLSGMAAIEPTRNAICDRWIRMGGSRTVSLPRVSGIRMTTYQCLRLDE
jgi:hypothetical protein